MHAQFAARSRFQDCHLLHIGSHFLLKHTLFEYVSTNSSDSRDWAFDI
jgi:hypothetical protein